MSFYRCVENTVLNGQSVAKGESIEFSLDPGRCFESINEATDLEAEYKLRPRPMPKKWELWGPLE